MVNTEQLKLLRFGVEDWNKWREENPSVVIDLSGAYLVEANLVGVNLSGANLSKADLVGSNLSKANLSRANLTKANLIGINLTKADLTRANLSEANLFSAYLVEANLSETNLSNTILIGASFMFTRITDAIVSNSKVFGVNVWNIVGEFKEQKDLIITPPGESEITVDNIKVAQFIYLIINNKEVRDVINILTSKVVLILGRFSPERKIILDAIRNKLREYDFLPIIFDFDRPVDRNLTETVQTLAGLSCFVIADVTNPKSSPLEIQATIPDLLVPCVPIIQEGESLFTMLEGLQQRPWVLGTVSYDSIDTLLEILKPHIIDPAIKMRDELRIIKAKEPTIISGRKLKAKGKKGKP